MRPRRTRHFFSKSFWGWCFLIGAVRMSPRKSHSERWPQQTLVVFMWNHSARDLSELSINLTKYSVAIYKRELYLIWSFLLSVIGLLAHYMKEVVRIETSRVSNLMCPVFVALIHRSITIEMPSSQWLLLLVSVTFLYVKINKII